MASSDDPSDDPAIECLSLRVEFEIGAPETDSCPLFTRLDEDPAQVSVDAHDGTCFIEVEFDDERDGPAKVRYRQDVGNCACQAFWEHECFPRVREVGDDVLIAETYVPDRSTLRALVAEIREGGRTVRVRKLTTVEDCEASPAVRVFDTGTLTQAERATLEYAVEMGYYDRERKVTLRAIAEEFGVTKQTCSERLGVAEAKMATDLFD